MTQRTPLYDLHVASGAKMVDFSGWEMPLHYGSQLEEHHRVRQEAGIFDVSHMGVVDATGPGAAAFLRYLLANNIDRLVDGKALYTCMLNEQGGVIDDLIVYRIHADFYRIVVNAGTREKDLRWMQQQSQSFDVKLVEQKDFSMVAIQGPAVVDKLNQFLPSSIIDAVKQLKPFTFMLDNQWLIARTGYTGENGYEIILPTQDVKALWQTALAANIYPCGLGARDTLRLEAGLNLYGSDMDETITPFEANLAWTVMLDPKERNFIGRAALEKQNQQGITRKLVGLVLAAPGIIRNHQKVVINGGDQGEVTSGGYSPTLEKSIAFARVPADIGEKCEVEIRGKLVPALVVKPPFVRQGKKMF